MLQHARRGSKIYEHESLTTFFSTVYVHGRKKLESLSSSRFCSPFFNWMPGLYTRKLRTNHRRSDNYRHSTSVEPAKQSYYNASAGDYTWHKRCCCSTANCTKDALAEILPRDASRARLRLENQELLPDAAREDFSQRDGYAFFFWLSFG